MGTKEEDGVLVGRGFDCSFWKLINLKERERENSYCIFIIILQVSINYLLTSTNRLLWSCGETEVSQAEPTVIQRWSLELERLEMKPDTLLLSYITSIYCKGDWCITTGYLRSTAD